MPCLVCVFVCKNMPCLGSQHILPFLEAPLITAPAAPALSVSRMPAKSSLPVGQDRGSATLGPKEGGVAGSRSPKAGSGPRPQCFSWCLSLPAAPAQPGDPRGPREGALRPLAGAGNDDTGRLWGRGRRLAQSPSYWDGLRSIPFPGEGNLLLPFPPLCLRGALRSRRFPKPQSLSRRIPRPRGQKGLRAWFWGRPALPFFLQGTKGRSASPPFDACRR